jgi:intracellular sulfur oxidation DsrE/DsrF family protein
MVISGTLKRLPGSSTIQMNVAVVDVTTRTAFRQEIPGARGRSETSASLATQKLAIQVAERDEKLMNLALNNAKNVIDYYRASGESIAVEIVTYGPGLHMLRADTSPVKDRIAAMALEYPELDFVGCAYTQKNMSKAENEPIRLISETKMTASGVVRLLELQEQGYGYIRP